MCFTCHHCAEFIYNTLMMSSFLGAFLAVLSISYYLTEADHREKAE